MINILIHHGRKPDLLSVKTTRNRLAKMPDEFTIKQLVEVNEITFEAGRKTIRAAKKYKFIIKLPSESQFLPATYRKVLK